MKYSWKCPKCGGVDLQVEVPILANLTQYEDNHETELVEGGVHEWDEYSFMRCCGCGCTGNVKTFEVPE